VLHIGVFLQRKIICVDFDTSEKFYKMTKCAKIGGFWDK